MENCESDTLKNSRPKMEKKVMSVCIIVGFLGLLAVALSIGAEAKKIKVSQLRYSSDSNCIFPTTPAVPLGLAAVVAITVAQATINIMTSCFCCRSCPYPLEPLLTRAIFCNTMSWFVFIIAILLLLTGVAMNTAHGEHIIYFNSYYCYVVKPGVFAGGVVFSLVAVGLGILSYINFELAKNNDQWGGPAANGQQGIAIGEIQFHPPDMIFVNGNTYARHHQIA